MADYVIIGGGSVGCAIAARLSETADVDVVLLEAGPRDTSPYIHMPVGFFKMTGGPLTWGYSTAPAKHAANRTIVYPQGRVLGGGSSINAQVYTRGAPEDFDRWANQEGCAGWSYREVLPYFRKSEDNERFSGSLHGTGGPLGVSDLISPSPLTKAFVKAAQEAGIPYNADFNGRHQEGCGLYQTTIRKGRRCSAAVGYLRPAMRRANLTVRTGCLTTRIRVENGRAVGVEYVENGRSLSIRAEREVIVAAGAIGSPKILMLSGIGPADQLRHQAIPVVLDLKGVGQNLQDHMAVDIVYELSGAHSYDRYKRPHWKLWAGVEYTLFKTGPVTSNIAEGGAFWWSDRGEPSPDLQFHFLPGAGVEQGVGSVPGGHGCTLNSYHVRPRSRGSVTLASADPRVAPIIDPNPFAEEYDLDRTIDSIQLSQEIMAQAALQRFVRREHLPGDKVRSRAEYGRFAREAARTAYHPVGTCKMGVDEWAVVDPQLRLHGIDALRVCDSSTMPSLVSANTNATSIMIGERAADFLKGNAA